MAVEAAVGFTVRLERPFEARDAEQSRRPSDVVVR